MLEENFVLLDGI